MRVYGRTDIGRVRQSNQDAFVCGTLSDTALFAVVCDGMGGANGGNIASAIAAKVTAERLVENYRDNMTMESVHNILESAVSAANAEIYDTALADPSLRGMGTTMVVAVVCGDQVCVAHVGDSRAYSLTRKERRIRQVTTDHSVVQEMIAGGKLTPAQAKNHPRKHFITRALGVEETVECDFTVFPYPENGMLLLCTDGLTNMVDTDEINIIAYSSGKDEIADRLIAAANMSGGSDNITVAVILPDTRKDGKHG